MATKISSTGVRTRSTTRTIRKDRLMAKSAINPRVRKAASRRVANYERRRKAMKAKRK